MAIARKKPKYFYGWNIVVDVSLYQRQKISELHKVCIGLADGAWAGKPAGTSAIMEPGVSGSLNNSGLSVSCCSVMEVKRLRDRIRGTPMNISIAGCGPEMVIGIMWIGRVRALKIGRQHAAD